MSLPIVINPLAADDLDEIRTHYEGLRAGLGDDFMDRVRDAPGRISDFPEIYPPAHKDARRGLVRRFPYAVLYRVDATRITVLAVYHTSRDPRSWQARV